MTNLRNVFNVPLSCSFWDTLAEIYLKRYAEDYLKLASTLFLVPNRRACQSFVSAFIRQQGMNPTVLPQIVPIAEIDDDDLFFNSFNFSQQANKIKNTISKEERLFLFVRLICSKPAHFGLKQISMAQALSLAEDLANLIDTACNQGLSFDKLQELVPEKYATHWQETLKLLQIITQYWPQILEERQAVDVCSLRQELLYQQALVWQQENTQKNIIIAGVTASFPAIINMMQTIMGLDNGEIYFSGLDKYADKSYWAAIDESHPQFELKELLEKLQISRHDVSDIAHSQNKSIEQFISELMRPAVVSDNWRNLNCNTFNVRQIVNSIQLIEKNSQREEALAIALKMREILNIPEKTVALITYDRNLARRVALELERFDIKVDDSAGIPLSLTSVGIYFRLICEAAQDIDSDIKLIALLKNPFTLFHKNAGEFRKKVYEYEYALRHSFSNISADLLNFINTIKEKLSEFHSLLTKPLVDFEELFKAHLILAEDLASSDNEAGKNFIWGGDAGRTAAKFFSHFIESAHCLGQIAGTDYLSLFCELMAKETIRTNYGTHPRLSILGPIEARLCHFDYVILGEINEGIWPKQAQADMWMSRPMKKDFGFSLPEKNIGILGADLCGFLAAPNVILTRAERIDGVPMRKSRWVFRLATVMQALGSDIEEFKKNDVSSCTHQIDKPSEICGITSPAPCPPTSARPKKLSASALDLLVADPYSFFAKYILKLYALDDLDIPLDQRDYGTLIHGIIEDFNNIYSEALPSNALDCLIDLGLQHFKQINLSPEFYAFWWPKFINTAKSFLAQDDRSEVLKINNEISGEITYTLPKGDILLTAKADRIDILKDGSINIIDYKTGGIPSKKQIFSGHALQLLLEGLIASKGKFNNLLCSKVNKLIYWHLGQTPVSNNILAINPEEENILQTCEDYILRLTETFDFETTPYLSRPIPKYVSKNKDYEHLARIKEWSVQEEDSDD